MLKETGYQEKIRILRPWMILILDGVKKDLRQEHLKMDRAFCKRYFLAKDPLHISAQEMAPAYEKDIAEGNAGLGEFIATRWLLKNTDIYGYFEERIKRIDSDFENLKELTMDQSHSILDGALNQFGAVRTYIFSVFNSVVFPKPIYESLRTQAEKETSKVESESKEKEEVVTLEALQKKQAREVAALTDRFEKKIAGLQKKYLNDTKMLKEQISKLQRKLAEKGNGS